MTSTGLKDALARHHGITTPHALTMTIWPDRLLNERHCTMLQRDLVDHCDSDGWDTMVATPSLGDHIPDKSGLYMFVWCPPFALPMASPSYGIIPREMGDYGSFSMWARLARVVAQELCVVAIKVSTGGMYYPIRSTCGLTRYLRTGRLVCVVF